MSKIEVQQYIHEEKGFLCQYTNSEWSVAIKNHKETSGEEEVNYLERHLQTDEIFILLQGKCTMISASEGDNGLEFKFINMKTGILYMIPQGLWHNTITYEGTKLVIIENANTTWDNSERLNLSKAVIKYQ